jgi:hypothetical protein
VQCRSPAESNLYGRVCKSRETAGLGAELPGFAGGSCPRSALDPRCAAGFAVCGRRSVDRQRADGERGAAHEQRGRRGRFGGGGRRWGSRGRRDVPRQRGRVRRGGVDLGDRLRGHEDRADRRAPRRGRHPRPGAGDGRRARTPRRDPRRPARPHRDRAPHPPGGALHDPRPAGRYGGGPGARPGARLGTRRDVRRDGWRGACSYGLILPLPGLPTACGRSPASNTP